MTAVRQIEVDGDDDGVRVDKWFKKHFPGLPFGRLEKLLRTGQVRVDGGRVKGNTRLEAGQTVRVPPLDSGDTEAPSGPEKSRRAGPRPGDAASLDNMTLYEDEDLLVLNKPPGLASQGGSGVTRHLDGMLAARVDRKGRRPVLVHRLDRDTSGLIVAAKRPQVARDLGAAFRGRRTRKVYWALTAGVPRPHRGTIDLPLAKKTEGRQERMVPADRHDPESKTAKTHYAVVAPAAQKIAWLALMPVTGRTHQLRAHCAFLETPILGDGKYGGQKAHVPGAAGKLHLHARELSFDYPEGRRMTFEAPLPPHISESFAFFGFDPDEAGDPFAELGR